MTKIKNPITLILFSSFFLISTCTNDNSITGNSNQALGKATDVTVVSSHDSTNKYDKYILFLIMTIM